MANKWNYRHNDLLPTGISVNAPDDNLKPVNCVYLDKDNLNSSDVAANSGSANVPFKTLDAARNSGGTPSLTVIAGKGTYTYSIGGGVAVIGDSLYNVIVDPAIGTNNRPALYGCVLKSNNANSGGGSTHLKSIIDATNTVLLTATKCLFLKTPITWSTVSKNVYIGITIPNVSSANSLFYNCVLNITTSTYFYNNVYWLGTLNYNALTSDLNTICPLIGTTYPTENDAIAKVETDLGLAVNTLKNNGFRLLNPHFINMSKGNFNIDFLNYDCTAILALRDSWDWIINRSVRCEYPTDFVGAVGAGFGEEPNLSDGFGGALYTRNINSSGVISNTAYDTVLVSKKYVLPQAYTLENINFFDKILGNAFELNATENDGTDTPNCYTYYLIGVKAGVLESVFNSINNTFSYNTGVLTCDFPRFMWNRSTQLNKDDNTIYGQIENGTFDLDYMRNIFKAGVKEFRIIAVKKGV